MGILKNLNNSEKLNSNKKSNISLPIIALRDTALMPGVIMPVVVGRQKSLNAVKNVHVDTEDEINIAVFSQKDPEVENPTIEDLYPIGVVATVSKIFDAPQKGYNILLHGLDKVKIESGIQNNSFLEAELEYLDDVEDYPQDELMLNAARQSLLEQFKIYLEHAEHLPEEVKYNFQVLKESKELAYQVSFYLKHTLKDLQELLSIHSEKKRLELMLDKITKEIEISKLSNKTREEITDKYQKQQREHFIREQIRLLQSELGETDSNSQDIAELREKFKNSKMDDKVRKVCEKELNRLEAMNPQASEYNVIRTYIDWLVNLPWNYYSEDNYDIDNAEKVLNKDHYGLDKVKKRILEFVAVAKLKQGMTGSIITLVGPPGVGKTSLGRAIAEALGRKYFRISLGGVHDEAEIRGHRRTYIGALPGRIIQGLRRVGTSNPVIQIDEIDKLGRSYRGDVASSLLEVLDPEQNDTFSDHYLELPYDLSKVLFIITANELDSIPLPLKDRMEVIRLPGYTTEEKYHIANKHLIKRKIEKTGIKQDNIKVTPGVIKEIISSYTRESGVRNLERELEKLCRKVAVEVAKKNDISIKVTKRNLHKYLGHTKYRSDKKENESYSGLATGLAWTPVGGDILFIESAFMDGKGKLKLTGKLGDVMKESAELALSYILSKSDKLEINTEKVKDKDVHIHVPSGAIPKDGPSAGVTILTSLTSLILDKPVDNDIAMTGEITLRGKVLPVGGIKEKVIAAYNSGIKKIFIPKDNEKDLEEIPQSIRDKLDFKLISSMEELLKQTNLMN